MSILISKRQYVLSYSNTLNLKAQIGTPIHLTRHKDRIMNIKSKFYSKQVAEGRKIDR